ncbi:hypothetical protein WISP_33061 [Willisornis vidua]|uniref:Uncharacterized protein n=1 Tax=Willisornis vidua TaxID=1566151 RepID=A0ABQ9DPT8_9PASS|nr:hypothetical protein WISP_33061 [Willisornis vidua]
MQILPRACSSMGFPQGHSFLQVFTCFCVGLQVDAFSFTARVIRSQLTLKVCRICCSSWISANLWGLMDSSKNSQRAADVIVKPLSVISECSWESEEVPAEWKLANLS